MIIQTISLEGIFGKYLGWHYFKKITDNNGNVIEYLYHSKEGSTKEELDKKYRELQNIGQDMKMEHTTLNITIDEYIKKLEKGIDQYVEYIDNGRQYREAVENNRKIEARIKKYEELKTKGVE